jgi:DNA gyrase subunit B
MVPIDAFVVVSMGFPAGPPRGMPDEAGPRRYYFRMRPVRAREGDRPLVPTLTADPGTPSTPKAAPASAAPASAAPAKTAPARTAPAKAPSAEGAYTARHLSVLEGLEAVRKRPGMYIGSTDGRGLQHCLSEIIDNAVDEALGGYCTGIEVTLHADGSAEVRDNGRGIPVDAERKTKLSGVELVMTRLHAGGKFGGGSYTASGGLHGVGASVVNALAARLDVEVDREGHTWAASFRRGVTGEFAGPGPDADFTRKSGLRQLSKTTRRATGTRIRFWPDRQVFIKDAGFSFAALTERARQTAYLVPGLTISIREEPAPHLGRDQGDQGDQGDRGDQAQAQAGPERVKQEAFRFDGGISEFCAHLGSGEPVSEVIRLTGSGSFTETIPVLDDRGHMTPTDVEREMEVDVALQWASGYDSVLRSFVNVIATPHGGTHVTGFERALTSTLNEQLKAARLLKGDDKVTKEDALEGLVAVVSVRLPEPQFEGQTKEVLGTPAATKIVQQVVSTQLGSYLESPPRGAKQQARAVLEKVISAAKARIAAREHRDNQRRKSALASSSLPAKLVDCRSADDRSELFIVEGDSALGTAKLARDSEFQALLPIRGKILNVQKASLADMLKNTECAAIIQVIGAGSGSSFDLDSARYQRVILMSDADVDGAHIRTLLLTLFHRYLRPMLDAGRIFAAVPPLHRIELSNVRKGQDKYRYTYSDAELNRTLLELERRGQRWKEPIQRYKGLGEMDASQLAETTMDPRYRTLRRIRIEDASVATDVFSLLMGSEVAPRRDFIVGGAAELDPSRIDI